jgi:hypothetical protein
MTILDAMESLDTFVKLTKMVNASKKAVSNKSNGGNQNSKKFNNKFNRGPIREATISRKAIHAKSTRESMTRENAQTINSPRTTKRTMVESLSILKELKPRRKLHSRRIPRTKPTSFEKRESQAWEIFMTLYKTKTITR